MAGEVRFDLGIALLYPPTPVLPAVARVLSTPDAAAGNVGLAVTGLLRAPGYG